VFLDVFLFTFHSEEFPSQLKETDSYPKYWDLLGRTLRVAARKEKRDFKIVIAPHQKTVLQKN